MFQDKIKRIVSQIDDVVYIAKKNAVNEIYGASKVRIFNKGLDKNENSLGGYSPKYKAKRAKLGRQTAFKDLTFSTNLQKSISRDEDTVYFANEYGKKISAFQEKQTKKRIFAPSSSERQIFIDILNEELTKLWK